MAGHSVVWGIDIGQTALKALRCRLHEDPERVSAEAFDYIEYPKLLSQPGAEPAELIAEALTQFLSRNSVKNCGVAVSVAGQNGLARFIKLPPVESKKIPAIVHYEARQQIPFDLNDVVWDYQRMGGNVEEEGFSLETEIGLFAMKRDQVFRAMEPFQAAGIEVDYVQLAPLTLYNFILFDQLNDLPPADEYDPDSPPESTVILSLGTDASDLVVTNGYRVWQRSVPIGGNHFTKALTKDLKLTFAKAEHLKRNASTAQDPTAVLRAMKPVFNDLMTEVQRSIGYFTSIERSAKIGRVLTLGNGMKLLGLRKLLSQGLGYEVVKLDAFRGLTGAAVTSAPIFQENLSSFAVCYGLCLQGLGRTSHGITTNLLPAEIVRDRLIREKKPWAVAAAALLLLGCTVSLFSDARALGTVREDLFKSAESTAEGVYTRATGWKSAADKARGDFGSTDQIGKHLVGNIEGRILWLELLRALNAALPRTAPAGAPAPDAAAAGAMQPAAMQNAGQGAPVRTADLQNPAAAPAAGARAKTPSELATEAAEAAEALREQQIEEIQNREELHVSNLEVQRLEDASLWWAMVKQWYKPLYEKPAPPPAPVEGEAVADEAAQGETAQGEPAQGEPAQGQQGEAVADSAAAPAATDVAATDDAAAEDPGPSGEGYVIMLTGHHYHNSPKAGGLQGAEYVRQTLIKNLHNMRVQLPWLDVQGNPLPQGAANQFEEVAMKDLGILYPVLVNPGRIVVEEVLDPYAVPSTGSGEGSPYAGASPMYGGSSPGYPGGAYSPESGGMAGARTTLRLRRFDFVVHIFWKPTPPSVRHGVTGEAGDGEATASTDQTAATMP